MKVFALFALVVAADAVGAAAPDLGAAEQMLREARYREAYDLLRPLAEVTKGDPAFDLLLGRAALGAKRPDEAKTIFERVIAAHPQSIAAHLGLARAYLALKQYERANIEFETVLRFEGLPEDLRQQAEIYAAAAKRYEAGSRALPFGYAVAGVGSYRVNEVPGSPGGQTDTFYNLRVGGGINYELDDNYAFDGTLDYRFRYYDNPDRRNDGDLRWNAAVSRSMGESNVVAGVRGRNSYRGDGMYRNDYGVFGDWRYRLDADNQLSLGAEVRSRQYPNGPLRDRSRDIAEVKAGWTRSFDEGRASFAIVANGGREWATDDRPDGDSNFGGLTGTLNFTLTEKVGGFVFGLWQHDAYNIERLHLGADQDTPGVSSRSDNLYEAGGGLTWTFAPGWSLNPEILYIRDQSNVLSYNYSSTEIWVNLRRDF
jgi:tetratricopeptide (TPR) repeat protein